MAESDEILDNSRHLGFFAKKTNKNSRPITLLLLSIVEMKESINVPFWPVMPCAHGRLPRHNCRTYDAAPARKTRH